MSLHLTPKAPDAVNNRHPARILVVLAALTLSAGPAHAAADADAGDRREPVPGTSDVRLVNSRVELPPGLFPGADGQIYSEAPIGVPGNDDHLFLGSDFDIACARGEAFALSMDRLAKLARIIDRSGRTVVWTLGYNKSSVFPEKLDRSALPHGRCDAVGLRSQAKIVRNYQDPHYLPLADKLARFRKQTYFKTDNHWSRVGGAVFAKALATRLSAPLGKQQDYTYGTEQWQGLINTLSGVYAPEIADTAVPDTRVKSVTASGSEDWAGWPNWIHDYSWKSSPAKRTYPGQTLLLGDSFSMYALENLLPLFRHGRWMWHFYLDPADMIDAIVRSDTVIVEVYQLFTGESPLTTRSFYRKLRAALQ